jgi:hypothetical protein
MQLNYCEAQEYNVFVISREIVLTVSRDFTFKKCIPFSVYAIIPLGIKTVKYYVK